MQVEFMDWFGPLMMGLTGVWAVLFGRWHSKRQLKKMNQDRKDQHPQPAE